MRSSLLYYIIMFKGELERLFFNESDSVLLQTAVLMESKHASRV